MIATRASANPFCESHQTGLEISCLLAFRPRGLYLPRTSASEAELSKHLGEKELASGDAIRVRNPLRPRAATRLARGGKKFARPKTALCFAKRPRELSAPRFIWQLRQIDPEVPMLWFNAASSRR